MNIKGIKTGDAIGHKPMMDLSNNMISVDTPIRNDIVSTTTIGSGSTPVLRDVHSYGPSEPSPKKIKGLVVRGGSGFKNKP